MKYFNVPGAAWVALITFLMSYLPQYFPNWEYIGVALTVLAMILKGIEVSSKPPVVVEPPQGAVARGESAEPVKATEVPSSKWVRVLLG